LPQAVDAWVAGGGGGGQHTQVVPAGDHPGPPCCVPEVSPATPPVVCCPGMFRSEATLGSSACTAPVALSWWVECALVVSWERPSKRADEAGTPRYSQLADLLGLFLKSFPSRQYQAPPSPSDAYVQYRHGQYLALHSPFIRLLCATASWETCLVCFSRVPSAVSIGRLRLHLMHTFSTSTAKIWHCMHHSL
jgi:hypothetical protein